MAIQIRVSNAYTPAKNFQTRVNNAYVNVKSIMQKVNGVYVTVWSAIKTTLNPLDWANMSVTWRTTNGASTSPNTMTNAALSVTGIDTDVTLRVEFTNVSATAGTISTLQAARSGAYLNVGQVGGGGTVTWYNQSFTVSPNTTLNFTSSVTGVVATALNSPRTSTVSYTVNVYNVTDGNTLVDTFTVSGTHVDAYSSGGGGTVRP